MTVSCRSSSPSSSSPRPSEPGSGLARRRRAAGPRRAERPTPRVVRWLERWMGRGARVEGEEHGRAGGAGRAVAAVAIGIAAAVPLYASALTEENLIYLEAWRAVR